MTALRRVLFWCHLTAGALAGVVILVLCATGVLLAFQPQVLAFLERKARAAPPAAAGARLPGGTLLLHASRSVPGASPTAVTVPSSSSESASVSFGRERTVYLDPATGAVLGEASRRGRAFFAAVQDLHRWLLVPEKSRPAGKAVTGAANLAFFGLVLTGLYIWWPRIRGIRRVSSVGLFQRGSSGKARDFNWHNVIGVWAAIPLLVLTATGMVISYRWAGDLVYRLAGSEPPPDPGSERPPAQPRRGAPSVLPRTSGRARPPLANRRSAISRLARDHATAARERARPGHVLDRGGTVPQPVRPLASDARSGERRGPQVGAVRRSERGPPGALVDALPPHGRVSRVFPARSSPPSLRRAAPCSPYTGPSLALRRFASWRRRRAGLVVRTPVTETSARGEDDLAAVKGATG